MSCSRTQHNLLPCAQAQTSGSRALHTNHKAIVASASHFMVKKCFSRARPAEIWQRKSYLTWRPRRCWSPELEYQRPGNPAARRRERWWRTWQQSHQRLWRTDGKKKCLESRSRFRCEWSSKTTKEYHHTLFSVADNWVMVLLKLMYLKTCQKDTKKINLRKGFRYYLQENAVQSVKPRKLQCRQKGRENASPEQCEA